LSLQCWPAASGPPLECRPRNTCYPDRGSVFQTAKQRLRLLLDAESIHFPRQSTPQLPPERSGMPQVERWLDCVAPISFLVQKLQCALLELVHALASAPGLLPARELRSSGALDLSRDT